MQLGTPLIVILCLIPIALWYETDLGAAQFTNLLSLGQISALVGAILLAINFILSTRLKFLEGLFGGLNKVYALHHTTGSLAVVFLSLHPVFLGFYHLKFSAKAAFLALFPPLSQPAVWFGIFSYTSLVILIILTLYAKIPYHIWKLTHKFMGVVLILAILHIVLIPSTVSYNGPLLIYMLSVLGMGLFCYLYRTLFGKLFVKRHEYKVTGVNFDHGVTKITLLPLGRGIKFTPGQFIFISFISKIPGIEEHPFSLTDAPNEKEISIAPKASGDYTAKLKNLAINSKALIEGPFGSFSYLNSPRKKQVWIAGGIGITPFVSMAKSFTKNNGIDAILYYQTSIPKEAVFLRELTGISKKYPNLKIIPVYTQLSGRISAQKVENEVPDFKARGIFICGPISMMKDLRSQFNKLGVRNGHIYSEEFSLD